MWTRNDVEVNGRRNLYPPKFDMREVSKHVDYVPSALPQLPSHHPTEETATTLPSSPPCSRQTDGDTQQIDATSDPNREKSARLPRRRHAQPKRAEGVRVARQLLIPQFTHKQKVCAATERCWNRTTAISKARRAPASKNGGVRVRVAGHFTAHVVFFSPTGGGFVG